MSAHPSTLNYAHIKALALKGMQQSIAVRQKAGLDMKSPACVYGICDSLGVNVRFNDINMEGMYDRSPKPRIHISALRPLARRNFTCAHELGHHVFNHGSSIDEMREDHAQHSDRPPEEILADSFAAFLLMPTLGLRDAFARRNLAPNKATAAELYAIACNFGVGQATLVNHLAYAAGMISLGRRAELGRITPKMIRTEVLGETVTEPLTIADEFWNAATLDMEEGALLLLPSWVVVDAAMLRPEKTLATGRLFRAVKPGISRVAMPGNNWATYVRIAKRQYVGLAKYRHLEDSNDD